MSCESTIRSEENNFEWYLKNSDENLLQGVKHVRSLKFRESVSKKDFKTSLNEKMLENWKKKQMYGQFIRDIPEGIDRQNSWLWMRKCNLKILTEALIICSVQEQAIKTNHIKYHIDKGFDSPSCGICGETGKTINHIMSEFSKLVQGE